MQVGEAKLAKGFHVYKNIRRSFSASEESEAAHAIEPSHLCTLERSRCIDDDMSASRSISAACLGFRPK